MTDANAAGAGAGKSDVLNVDGGRDVAVNGGELVPYTVAHLDHREEP